MRLLVLPLAHPTTHARLPTVSFPFAPGLPTYALFNTIGGSPTEPKLGWAEVTFFMFSSFVLGIVEIPMLCACYDWCRVLAKYTRPIAGLWVGRAVVHLLVAAGILGVGVNQGSIGGTVRALR